MTHNTAIPPPRFDLRTRSVRRKAAEFKSPSGKAVSPQRCRTTNDLP